MYDPVTGTWSLTGNLNAIRAGHTATLLNTGKVLAVAGLGLASAELYDPATNAWSPTGSLNSGRDSHQATLLPDGRVLITGGTNDADLIFPLSYVETYDPVSGTWIYTAGLHVPRSSHSATLLPDGNVLVAGGDGPPYIASIGATTTISPTSTNAAELFNAVTNQWSPTASLNAARTGHTATRMPDGSVLVVGGEANTFQSRVSLDTSERFGAATDQKLNTRNLNTARAYHTATLLSDGRLLVTGGCCALNTAELYVSSTDNSFRITDLFSDLGGFSQYIRLTELSYQNGQNNLRTP